VEGKVSTGRTDGTEGKSDTNGTSVTAGTNEHGSRHDHYKICS
jgi:hypothetical protein